MNERTYELALIEYGNYSEANISLEVETHVKQAQIPEILSRWFTDPRWKPGFTGITIDEESHQ